jgi:hypothetical protein
MTDLAAIFRQKAFLDFPGIDYNSYREKTGEDSSPPAVYYEIPLPANPVWELLRDQVYPHFIRFLKAKSLNPEQAPQTVVTVFLEDNCLLINGKDFLEIFRKIEGCDEKAFHALVIAWLDY